MLLQIQFKPSQKAVPLQPEKLKWESRPRTAQAEPATEASVPAPAPQNPPKKDYRHGRLSGDKSGRPRPVGDRTAARSGSDRSAGRPSGARPGRPSDRPGKPSFDRRDGKPADRPPRPSDRPSGDRPFSKPSSDRSAARHPADRPYNRPAPGRPAGRSSERPGRPSSDRPRRPADGERPAHRPSSDRPARPSGERPHRPASERPPYRSSSDRPTRRADEVVDPKTGKKFDEKRPRDTRIGQGNKAEPKRRLTAEESFDLPKPWIIEIQELARPGTGSKVAEAISKALEHFADEEYEDAARLAAEAKSSASRSPRVIELLGLALYHSGQWKEALSELLTFRRLTASVEHNHVIADLYRALERPDRALETTAEVSQADVTPETWVETMIVAAGALADKGDLNRAITMLARADPGPGPVEPYFLRHWYARADLLERAGRKDEARNLWRKIVATDPDFFDAEERLAAL